MPTARRAKAAPKKAAKGVGKGVAKGNKKRGHLKLVPKPKEEQPGQQQQPWQQQKPYSHPFSQFMRVRQPSNTSSFIRRINLHVPRRRAG